jgi:aryl carrier-like protein
VIKHNLVLLPKSGLCKERLVAVISLTNHTADDQPLCLFDGPEKTAIYSEIEAIRAQVSSRLPLYMLPTVWIAVTALPRLSSGKLDRKRVTQWITEMPTDVYQRAIPASEESQSTHEPTNDTEKTLRAIWAHVLNLPEQQVALDRPFLTLGGDSISAMQVMGQCRKKGLGVGVQDILRSRSIPQLAATVKTVKSSMDHTKEEIEKPFDLTPIQSLWFQLPNQGHGHFNQSFYLKVNRKTTANEFHEAVEKLISRHSMLRARFSYSVEKGWQQRVTEDVANSYRFRHRTVSTKAEIDSMIEDSQTCLNHSTGPLFAADLFEFGSEQHAFLVAHHLVIDLVTWRLLLEELEEILKGETLLSPALPFQTWAHLQSEHAKTFNLDKVLPSVEIPAMDFSYWGIQHAENTYGNASHSSFELDSSLTSLFLGDCHAALKTEPVEVLLASLIQSWSRIFTDR